MADSKTRLDTLAPLEIKEVQRQIAAAADTISSDIVVEGLSNLFFTAERAQDAVGNILTDSSTIDFTYSDVGNTITADLKTGVDAAKIADGTVSSTEFQYINSLTSNAQTQINAKQAAITPSTGWTTSNVTPDKTLDANSTSVDELADVLCTLIEALKTQGLLGA